MSKIICREVVGKKNNRNMLVQACFILSFFAAVHVGVRMDLLGPVAQGSRIFTRVANAATITGAYLGPSLESAAVLESAARISPGKGGGPGKKPPTATTTPENPAYWSIRSISTMKETKDKICNQDSKAFIDLWIAKALELGVNYIAVETPYDDPSCGSSLAYTKAWVDAVHAKGLGVWHRHMPLEFEGIYGMTKNNAKDFIGMIASYIKTNPGLFKAGDIFTPIPEPQNGGIQGITYCHQSVCMFPGAQGFNAWLRNAITASEGAFGAIGLGGKMKIGYYGFDGFIAWGDNNPDWNGILEDATVQAMGNITIDHYPESVGDTMANDLNELQAKYPTVPIIIGEWGTVTGGDTVSQVQATMQASIRQNVVGFNYWHMGMGGNEALVNSDFTNRPAFDAVKSFFRR